MTEPTVSAGYVKALLSLAVEKGADPAPLLADAGLDAAELGDPDRRILFARFAALMRAAKTRCNDPALALHFGERSLLLDMSIVGLICHAAETMGEAFEEMNRYARLVIEVDGHEVGARFAIVRRASEVWLEDRRRNPNLFSELTESTFARFVADTLRYHGDVPFVRAVHVTHRAPAYRGEYERIFKVPITFESDRNALLIEESWLRLKTHRPNRYVFGVLSDRAAALLKSLQATKTLRGRVENELISILHTGALEMKEIARRMGLSRPTLYRKLRDEGVSYETVLDELRHKLALHYLEGKKASVNEVAYLVGFSDASSFSRAFKRWTGHSPGQR